MIYTHFDHIPRLRYGFLMIDPPWRFHNYSAKGEKLNPVSQYECMTIDQIKALPVAHIVAHDAVIWVWATNPMMPAILDVINTWGFRFCTMGTWLKTTRTGKMRWGPGYWLRSTNEPFIIATMGKPQIRARNIPSGFAAEAREHSRKPEQAYEYAERMSPDAWRMDLFSRQERAGWDSFGNQPDKFTDSSAGFAGGPETGHDGISGVEIAESAVAASGGRKSGVAA